MKEWITIGLLVLNAMLLAMLTLCCGAVLFVVLMLEGKWTPTLKQAVTDIHEFKVLAAEKIDPVTDGLNAVAKSVNDFRIFRGEADRGR